MTAQKRGILTAIEKSNNDNIKKHGLVPFNLNELPEPCKGVVHKKAGVCLKCRVKFVKWVCYDDNDNFLYETYQPYGKYVRDPNSPRIIELFRNLEIFE